MVRGDAGAKDPGSKAGGAPETCRGGGSQEVREGPDAGGVFAGGASPRVTGKETDPERKGNYAGSDKDGGCVVEKDRKGAGVI